MPFESHHSWQDRMVLEHAQTKPFSPENGNPLKFKIGDVVIYTNDSGVEFKCKINGFYQPAPTDSLYATGYRYLLNNSSYWMPVRENSLRLATPEDSNVYIECGDLDFDFKSNRYGANILGYRNYFVAGITSK